MFFVIFKVGAGVFVEFGEIGREIGWGFYGEREERGEM